MRPLLRIAALALAASPILSPTPCSAGEWTHRVLAGESASAIAKRYYGSFEPTRLLLDYNGREGPALRAGETLRIPYCEVHVVRAGDTWSALARKYLGRGAAWPTMAELNGRAPGEALPRGARIVAPVTLVHRLARGETLAALAQRYYGDPDRAAMLAEFNGVDDPRRLSVGQQLGVPLIDFVPQSAATTERTPSGDSSAAAARAARATANGPVTQAPKAKASTAQTSIESKPVGDKAPATKPVEKTPVAEMVADDKADDATPKAGSASASGTTGAPGPDAPGGSASRLLPPVEVPPATPPRFAAPLRRAQRAFREARFGSAREQLDRMRDPIVSDGVEEELEAYWTLRAFLAVAEDREVDACEAWGNLPAGRAAPPLDPDLVSPRVREVLGNCSRTGSDAQAVTRRSFPPSS